MLLEHKYEVRSFLLERAGLPPEERSEGEEIEVSVRGNGKVPGGSPVAMRGRALAGNSSIAVGRLAAEGLGGRVAGLKREESGSGKVGNVNGEEDSDTIMVAGGVAADD